VTSYISDSVDKETRPVKLGAEFDGSVEVLDGVIPADGVVSFRSLLLKGTAK